MDSSWHSKNLDAVRRELATNFDAGLSADEARRRISQYGQNILPQGKKLHWWQLFFRQFKNPLVLILLVAAALTYWLHEPIDTAVILLAVCVNAGIGFFQEFRSNSIFEKLQALVTALALVRRGGKTLQVDSRELVPGDIIHVVAGAKVPGDARIISETMLEVNEALLTGESIHSHKNSREVAASAPLAERTNMLYTGTIVERGEARAVVVAIGAATEVGQIARLTSGISEERTPLQERLSSLSTLIVWFVSLSAAGILIIGLGQNRSPLELFTIAVAVAVAAIPEGLPAALSVVLAVAADRILAKRGLVKTLIGAETLGSTSVICTDKTGTLTEGRMRLEESLLVHARDRFVRALAFANEAEIVEADGKRIMRGDATDRAKLEYATAEGGDISEMLAKFPRVAFLHFSEEEKYIASFHHAGSGDITVYVTGAPEVLLEHARMREWERKEIFDAIELKAASGFRLIGAAEAHVSSEHFDPRNREHLRALVNNLTFLGLAVLGDPIRKDVPAAIAEVRRAGVRVIMITGDHRLTARAIGASLRFSAAHESILDGEQLETLDDAELLRRMPTIEIIARASPKHKLRIIKLLREQGEVVAMTGDGVNDAPALKAADIGIAVGSGSDVTKEASDLVLLDDSFAIIVSAIKQGRVAFDNIRKVTIFLLSNSFTELIIVIASLVFGLPLPITAVQILWANLVEDGFPNFALAFEPESRGIMSRRPLKRTEPILDTQGMAIIFVAGILRDLVLVGVFMMLYFYSGLTIAYIRTMMFALLATDSLIYVFAIKSLRESLFHTRLFDNSYLLFAIGLGMLAMIGAVYVPPLQTLLGTVPLNGRHLIGVVLLGFFSIAYVECAKWWFRIRLRMRAKQTMSHA